ncbi:MAG: hypothetical protein KBT47_03110, partial [Armatimonadetes bacterium]|nr:hypothetical protein [Candidatus Hippobium faecium]
TQSANIGVVMECGDGGNGSVYYSTPDAYLNAYELTASCQADYIELDFWPNFAGDYKDAVNNIQYRDRMRNLLSYGMGFNSAKKDRAKRLSGDFSVVSSRRHIRIFNPEWQPWSWCLDTNAFTPEKGLSCEGYIFEGLSQEGVEFDTAKNVIWAADMPVKKNFDGFLDKIRKGKIKNGFLMAQACRKVIDHKMHVFDFGEKYPEMEIRDTEKSPQGIIEVFGKEVGEGSFGKVWDSFGETVATCGGVPVVKRQKMGSSYLYIVLVSEYNGDLWKALLENIDIHNSWFSDNGAVARIYLGDKMKIVGVQSPIVRDPGVFNKEKSKSDYQYLKYRCDDNYSVKVKF